MFKNLRYRFAIFMQGRYGTDQLSRFLSIVVVVLIVFDWIANAFLAFPGPAFLSSLINNILSGYSDSYFKTISGHLSVE